MPFNRVEQVLEELRRGRIIVLVDDERRENEGDLICAAEHVTPAIVNFMLSEGRGMLFVGLSPDICTQLDLPPQTAINTTQKGTAYTVTVDAHHRFGITTGVSAADRAATIRVLANPASKPADLARPGHVQPIRAREGGVLVRTGHTEGMTDLCRLAGLRPAAIGIEVMNDDGSMARLPQLQSLCEKHKLKMCSVADVIAYRIGRDKLIDRIDEADFTSEYGQFRLIAYRSRTDALPHIALVKGRVGQQQIDEPVLVRMHSQNLLGDVLGDSQMPSGRTLHQAMRMIERQGEGAIVYLRQDGMGTGLLQRLQTLHEAEEDESRREARQAIAKLDYGVGSQILRDLGLRKLRLITNHPPHLHGLEGFGLEIVETVGVT